MATCLFNNVIAESIEISAPTLHKQSNINYRAVTFNRILHYIWPKSMQHVIKNSASLYHSFSQFSGFFFYHLPQPERTFASSPDINGRQVLFLMCSKTSKCNACSDEELSQNQNNVVAEYLNKICCLHDTCQILKIVIFCGKIVYTNLNPETELKRYFGARAVLGDQRPRHRNRQFHRSTWMTNPKDSWPRFSRPGISMSLLESKDGIQYFAFEHSREYQQVQFKFLDAVESMDPNNIVALLQLNPYHIDSLLQLSDVCRIQEDQEMARDLIERALYSFECAFHPLFSLTSGTCRLDYLRPENRFVFPFLMMNKMTLCNSDPLCMLLLIDFLMLRSREYQSLLQLYQDWEEHKNLSQLPNFAFSTALCHFHLSQQEDMDLDESQKYRHKADQMLQNALIMFPGVLIPLLDLCSVQPDATVSSHAFFGPRSQIGQPPALAELTALYVGRTYNLWREAAVMLWLEECVKEVLRQVDASNPLVEDCQNKRKQRYQSAPRNIHRHVLLSEIKEATSNLPLEVTTQPVMGFDPLPPLDSVMSYTRPERQNVGASNESTLSLFFRSLLPNFNLQVSLADKGF
uniref:Transcription factor 25 (basic helix-loop-helix) n=1 Tax=Sphaeramia orbicularis TaxID=375764 RepID=A0A673ANH2_9TELE